MQKKAETAQKTKFFDAKKAATVLASVLAFGSLNPTVASATPDLDDCVTQTANITYFDTVYRTVTVANPGECEWQVPAGITSLSILVVAGGGGGGGGQATVTPSDPGRAGGGGGGAGAVGLDNNVSVTPGSAIVVTVGAGGAAGELGTPTVPPTSGSRGGTSSYVLADNTTGGTAGGFGGGPGNYLGGTGGAEGFSTFSSPDATGGQGTSGSSGNAAGSATTLATVGTSVAGFYATSTTLAYGGGGAATFSEGATEGAAGSGGGGGKGSQLTVCSGEVCNGFDGTAGRPGVVVFRFASTAPSAPAAPTAQVDGTQADIDWSAPSSDGFADITGYKVESSTDSGETWSTKIADTGNALTTATIENLADGPSYLFRVSAINAVAISSASSASNAVSLAPPGPVPYAGPQLTNLAQRELQEGIKTQITIQGLRLDGVTSASIDGKVATVISKTSTSLVIELPALTAGLKDLELTTSIGNLIHQDAFRVLASAAVSDAAVEQKLNAGSFKGFVAIYAKGYEGKRFSAKVGKDWVVIPSLKSGFERIVEFTGAGVPVTVRVFLDRALAATFPLVTQ